MTQHAKPFRWFVAALVSGFALLLITRIYYAFIFLPAHHGSFGEAASRLIDFAGWLSFVRSGPGAVLHLAAAACFVTAIGLLFCRLFRD